MCDINKQTQDDAKQTNRFPRYQLLEKETNNIKRRRRQLLGSHARFIENSLSVTNTNTRRKTIKRSTSSLSFDITSRQWNFHYFSYLFILKQNNEISADIKNYRIIIDLEIIPP